MAASYFRPLYLTFIYLITFVLVNSQNLKKCQVPRHFLGEFFTHERGTDISATFSSDGLVVKQNTDYDQNSKCVEFAFLNQTNFQNRSDARILFYDAAKTTYFCWELYFRTRMVLEFKQSSLDLQKFEIKTLKEVCKDISPDTKLLTMFKMTEEKINCKVTIEGSYHFTYETSLGGGGICNSQRSQITACQEPGSQYIDNEVFIMNFAKCADVSTSMNERTRFQCLGSWQDNSGNIFSAVADTKFETPRDRYRCLLTRKDQQTQNNEVRWSLSRWAGCSTLLSPYEGDIRLILTPIPFISKQILPLCNLPRDFTGSWFTTGEFDTHVVINSTHIYFNTKLDQYSYKETYFTCQMSLDSRYLMTATTVGKCEVDYVCFDFVPRHHNIIRWRLSKPYRLSSAEMDRSDYLFRKFRQTCTWTSFTINREDFNWKYNTFVLNPPSPINCPIAGRYTFKQSGSIEEHYTTRVRGITERPRHRIDCREYITEFKVCSGNSKKILIDAEYCATVDHTGKPIGEYDIPDRELSCVGYWMEDMKSYLITYDEEDAISKFRCWVYERLDWRDIVLSRATRSECGVNQNAYSNNADEGATLALTLKENERIFDSCPQKFDTGSNPFKKSEIVYVLNRSSALTFSNFLMILIPFMFAVFLE